MNEFYLLMTTEIHVIFFGPAEEAQEICRETGAINFVLDLLTTGKDAVKIAAMYMLGCACEKNGKCQT